MKFIHSIIPLFLAACGGGGIDITDSGFRSPSSGIIPVTLDNEQNNGTTRTFGNAIYVTGFESDRAVAYSGLENLGDAGAMPSGVTIYAGAWEVIGIENVSGSASSLSGTNFFDGGDFNLTFDPADGSLSGSAVGTAAFEVDGTVVAGEIDGSVTYDSVTGPLDGILGVNGLIGAFHGNSDSMVYAGGIRSD